MPNIAESCNLYGNQDLFNRIGPVLKLSLTYDRAGRSEGIAYVTYASAQDAKRAIREFDGANAKGMTSKTDWSRRGLIFPRSANPPSCDS